MAEVKLIGIAACRACDGAAPRHAGRSTALTSAPAADPANAEVLRWPKRPTDGAKTADLSLGSALRTAPACVTEPEPEPDIASLLDAIDDEAFAEETKKHSGIYKNRSRTYTFNAQTGRLTLSQPEHKGTTDVYI